MKVPREGMSAPCSNSPDSQIEEVDTDNKEGVCRCQFFTCFVNGQNTVTTPYQAGKDPYSRLGVKVNAAV